MTMIMLFRKEMEVLHQDVIYHVQQCSVNFHSCEKKTEENHGKFEHVFKEIQGVQRDIRKLKSSSVISKPTNEININGLPKNLPSTRLDAVKRIFTSLQILDLVSDVINKRDYVNKQNNRTSSIIVTVKSDVIFNFIVTKNRKKRELASS